MQYFIHKIKDWQEKGYLHLSIWKCLQNHVTEVDFSTFVKSRYARKRSYAPSTDNRALVAGSKELCALERLDSDDSETPASLTPCANTPKITKYFPVVGSKRIYASKGLDSSSNDDETEVVGSMELYTSVSLDSSSDDNDPPRSLAPCANTPKITIYSLAASSERFPGLEISDSSSDDDETHIVGSMDFYASESLDSSCDDNDTPTVGSKELYLRKRSRTRKTPKKGVQPKIPKKDNSQPMIYDYLSSLKNSTDVTSDVHGSAMQGKSMELI